MADDKKDLTGIFELQKQAAANPDPTAVDIPVDPFAVNELQAIEQVDEFQSIDQIGMMDHPETIEPAFEAAVEPLADAPMEDQFPVSASESSEPDPFAVSVEPTVIAPAEASFEPVLEPTVIESSFSNVRAYSERTQGKTNLEVKIHYPFHLRINGTFGPFERDKLLMFITENPIGLSSADLDLQIQAGKVFLPRISEYPAVKLVQDLRDSGLDFSLSPSDQSEDSAGSTTSSASARQFHYQSAGATSESSTLSEIPILNESSSLKFHEIDQVSIVQFVRTEVLEVENSPIIQEVIERMTESLKQKARLKGGSALLNLKQEILPLRLPSQYQISLKASVVKY